MSKKEKHNKKKSLFGLAEKKKGNLPTTKKSNAGGWVLLGLGLTATGALSYFGYQYWKKQKEKKNEQTDTTNNDNKETESPSNYTPPKYTPKPPKQAEPKNTVGFPMIKGSKGELVKTFQEALIAKHGKIILPKYGADGDFGSEMLAALKKLGLGETITETTFNLYTKGASPDHSNVAKDLFAAAVKKDFNKAISLLKTLRNVEDYKTVSDTFKNYRIGAVRQTLVNGMLNSFTDAKQKDAIRLVFSNMGLKYDGNKWSLSGIDNSYQIITLQNTKVWKNPRTSVNVPANMVLGKYITNRGEFTLFQNDGLYYLVETQHVKQHNK